jgi:hypothetical protein
MAGDRAEGRFFEQGEGIEIHELWTEEEVPDAEPAPSIVKGRGNKYVARRYVERYWEWKALRNQLDDFDIVDPDF